VVIPTKNRCNLLVQCLQSVLAQSFRDFEVIIINDGSEDATQETVEVFKDDRIRYFELPRSIGIPKARNFGLLQAKGEYVAIVDDDDIQLPHRFEEQVKKLDDGFDVAYGGWVSQGNGRNFVRKSCPFSLARLLLIGKMCSHGGLMIRKSTLEKESYNEGLMYGSDYELVIRLAARGYRFGRIDRIMNIIRVQDDGVTILNKDYQRNVGELAVKNAFEEMSEEERKEIFEERDRLLIEDQLASPELVSIIVAVRNENIAPIFDALANQSFQNFEVVLINVGPPGDYLKLIQLYSFEVKYVWNKNEKKDMYWIKNVAQKLAKGNILVFLDVNLVPKTSDWLMRIVSRHILNDDLVLVHGKDRVREGGVLEFEKRVSLEDIGWDKWNFSIRSRTAYKIGLFYGDWIENAKKAGAKFVLGQDILAEQEG